MLNINNLHNEILEREAKKDLIYEEVYKKVVDKIKYTNKKSNDCFLIYSCPNYIYGIPKYSLIPCITYIMKKLTDNYFRVNYYSPNILFISWQHLPPKSASTHPLSYIPTTQHTLLEYQEQKKDIENKKSKQYLFNEIDKEFLLSSTKYKGGIERMKEEKRTQQQPINYQHTPNNFNHNLFNSISTKGNINKKGYTNNKNANKYPGESKLLFGKMLAINNTTKKTNQ